MPAYIVGLAAVTYSRPMNPPLLQRPPVQFTHRLALKLRDDNTTLIAAGVAFYGLIAIFPSLLGLVSLFGFFLDPTELQSHLSEFADVMPTDAYRLIEAELTRLAGQGRSQLGTTTLISLGVALWGAGKGVRAMMAALNVVYQENESRGFFQLHLVSLGLTLVGLMMAVIMLITLVMIPVLFKFLDWIPWLEGMVKFLRWPIIAGFLFLALSGLYRFGASRTLKPTRMWPDWGAMTAIVLWLLGSVGLSYYVAEIAGYSATYQGLSAVIVLMMWLWMSSLVVLVGASVNAQISPHSAPAPAKYASSADRTDHATY